ncbi:MAG: PPC domain-containing protein [Verrucomicrobiota bacterium]
MKIMQQVVWLAVMLAATSVGFAQRGPSVGYVYPAGGRQGTTFQATLSGQFLDGVTNVLVTGEGVQATIVEFIKPYANKQLTFLRDRMEALRRGVTAAGKSDTIITVRGVGDYNSNEVQKIDRVSVEKELADLKYKLSNPKNQRPPNPQLAEDVKLRVTIAANAKPGQRELRLLTALGLSNPLVFHVGQLQEFNEPPEVCLSGPNLLNPERYNLTRGPSKRPEVRLTLPCVANGQIMPGAIDGFRFYGRKGQKLVVAVNARQLIPYLADAVPGWFQATVTMYDPKGKEIAYADDFRFNPDPVLNYEIPADGDYLIQIKDSIFRGREDFVYRITIGELPFVTGIFPLGGPAGAQNEVEVAGWNLPATKVTLDTAGREPGIHTLAFPNQEKVLNTVLFQTSAYSEVMEKEPNNQESNAQRLRVPTVVNGRIDQPDDEDVFRFEGQAGKQIVAEVFARRLNSPLDSILTLTDSEGKQIAINDDYDDRASGLVTHQADSRISISLPADGTYYLRLRDTQHKGGPEYAYRLYVHTPQPDFELRMTPASLNVRPGNSVQVTLYAVRKDGFTGDISFVLKDAPTGFRLSGKMPGNTNQVRLTLSAPDSPLKKPVSLTVEGRGMIQGKEVAHLAVPAEDMMQAFYYRHLVPFQELEVAMLTRNPNAAKKAAAANLPKKLDKKPDVKPPEQKPASK